MGKHTFKCNRYHPSETFDCCYYLVDMEKKKGELRGDSSFTSVGVALSLVTHLLWIGAFCYVAVYISSLSQRLEVVNHANEHLQTQVDSLKKVIFHLCFQ